MSLKEENLIAYNGTLKKGQRLVKVGNSFMPVGVGGGFEQGSGSSGRAEIPEKEMPTDGLTFYWSMANDQIESGQTVKASAGNYNFTTLDDVPCCYIERGCYFSFDNTFAPLGSADRTVSFWHNSNYDSQEHSTGQIFAYGQPSNSKTFNFAVNYSDQKAYHERNSIGAGIFGIDLQIPNGHAFNTWEHVVCVVKDKVLYMYLNGYLKGTLDVASIDTQSGDFNIGMFRAQTTTNYRYQGYVSDFRVYDRALDDEEIKLLASEHCNYCVNSSGGSTECTTAKFYKCASVDTTAKTWSGYEAVMDEAGYVTFLETEKQGLTYSIFTPAVEEIWSENGMLQIAQYSTPITFPTDFAFDIPLDNVSTYGSSDIIIADKFGITCYDNKYLTVNKEIDGVTCLYFYVGGTYAPRIVVGNQFFAANDTEANASTGYSARFGSGYPWTYSFWFYPDSSQDGNGERGMFHLGLKNTGNDRRLCLRYNDTDGTFRLLTTENDSITSDWGGAIQKDKWHHICVIGESNARVFHLYVDGSFVTTLTHPSQNIPTYNNYKNPRMTICNEESGAVGFTGGLAKMKWYNRVLDTGEIAALSQEIQTA